MDETEHVFKFLHIVGLMQVGICPSCGHIDRPKKFRDTMTWVKCPVCCFSISTEAANEVAREAANRLSDDIGKFDEWEISRFGATD